MISFGLNVSPSVSPGHDAVADAVRAEELGFDFISVNDHLHGSDPRHETWTLLTWIAASTKRIAVLPRVLGLPYRPPAVVAKMAETLDRLSGGRVILGLGGGAVDEEFQAFGLDVRTPRRKIDALSEALLIIRGLWREERFSLDGEVYRTQNAQIEPKPAHAIPMWLGTFGPRGLALVGTLADGWIPSYEMAPPERIPQMRGAIIAAAESAGRDPDRITCAYNIVVRIDDQPQDGALSGSIEWLTQRLIEFAGLGFRAFNFIVPERDDVDVLGREVVPRVRSVLD